MTFMLGVSLIMTPASIYNIKSGVSIDIPFVIINVIVLVAFVEAVDDFVISYREKVMKVMTR